MHQLLTMAIMDMVMDPNVAPSARNSSDPFINLSYHPCDRSPIIINANHCPFLPTPHGNIHTHTHTYSLSPTARFLRRKSESWVHWVGIQNYILKYNTKYIRKPFVPLTVTKYSRLTIMTSLRIIASEAGPAGV